MSPSTIERLVPVLTGPNYVEWQPKAENYLRAEGLWSVVSGSTDRPKDLPAGTESSPTDPQLLLANIRAQADWDKDNDKAIGMICLRLATSLHYHKTAESTAASLWTTLKEAYNKPGPGVIYADFKQAVNFKISGATHPLPEITRLWTLLERLEANGCKLEGSVRAMLLLNALPDSMFNVVSYQVSDNDFSSLSFNSIRDNIVADHEHRNPRPSMDAHRLSAVRRKGGNPRWKQQQKSSNSNATGSNASALGKGKRGKRAGKKSKDKGSSNSSNDHHGHSHIASVATDPFVAAPTLNNEAAFALREKGMRKKVDPNPLRYSGMTPGPSAYADVNLARQLCSEINVPKTARNMEVLEAVASSSKRLLQDDVPAPESKRSRSMDLDMDPNQPINWDTMDFGTMDGSAADGMDLDLEAQIDELLSQNAF